MCVYEFMLDRVFSAYPADKISQYSSGKKMLRHRIFIKKRRSVHLLNIRGNTNWHVVHFIGCPEPVSQPATRRRCSVACLFYCYAAHLHTNRATSRPTQHTPMHTHKLTMANTSVHASEPRNTAMWLIMCNAHYTFKMSYTAGCQFGSADARREFDTIAPVGACV